MRGKEDQGDTHDSGWSLDGWGAICEAGKTWSEEAEEEAQQMLNQRSKRATWSVPGVKANTKTKVKACVMG